MIISEKVHSKILNTFLLIIATTLIFRKPATIMIISFIVYSLLNLKKLSFNNKLIFNQVAIMSPLLIQLFFLWNNDSILSGLKDVEKYICLLIFPLFIIGNYKYVKVNFLLENYCLLFCLTISILYVRYLFYFPELYHKYQNGIHQWEMGYSFANSFNTHAPALNMHIAFSASISFYFLIQNLIKKTSYIKIGLNLLVFCLLFYFILYVNTRLALVNFLIAILLIICSTLFTAIISKRIIFISISIFMFSLFTIVVFAFKNPYMIEKYTVVTFDNIDKIGRLDEIDNVQAVACNALVTRISIWISTKDLLIKKPFIGYGSADGKQILIEYFKTTNQQFLYRNKFPVHNQFLDFFLKFGFLGGIVFFIYFLSIFKIGIFLKNVLVIAFFIIFFSSNLTDDFLIRFDGIVYSGFWISCFICLSKQKLEQIKF